MAPLMGAHHLMRPGGGRGVLVCGVPGVRVRRVVVIGAGVAGLAAATMAVGMHAEVFVLDRNLDRLRESITTSAAPSRRSPRRSTPSRRSASTPTSSSEPCWSSGARAPAGLRRAGRRRCGRDRCWSTSRWTKAAASSRPGRRPIRTRPSRCTARCSTAWPTCRARCPTPRPTPWPMRTLPYVVNIANQGWQAAVRGRRGAGRGRERGRRARWSTTPVAEAHGLRDACHWGSCSSECGSPRPQQGVARRRRQGNRLHSSRKLAGHRAYKVANPKVTCSGSRAQRKPTGGPCRSTDTLTYPMEGSTDTLIR